MNPGMTPERLPNDIETAFPGRFAVPRGAKGKTKAEKPSDREANPDSLLKSGVYVPDHK